MNAPVLIVGIDDAEVRTVMAALADLGQPYVFLSTRAPLELAVTDRQAQWCFGEQRWTVDAEPPPFSAVYVRLLGLAPTHPIDSPHWTRDNFLRARFYDGEILALKMALLQHLQARGVPMYNGVSVAELEIKAWRLIALRRAGLPVPDSLFTSDPAALQRFVGRHHAIVYKPVTGGTRVRMLTDEDLGPERSRALTRAPVAFQACIPGPDLRVYVCDGEVIAAVRVHSDHEVDTRGRETGYEVIALAGELATVCVRASEVTRLRFSAVDVRGDRPGEFCLLECNNHPMFASIDRAIGGAVARGLARRLAQLSAAP